MVEIDQPPAAFREGQVEADGFRIRYLEAGQGEAVVMLDSLPWGLTRLHHALAQKYRVVALEIPGFGNSPSNTRSQSVQDLANTIAQAAAKLVPERYTLIGTSFGANLALWQTLQAPDRVEVLVLISPTAILPAGDPTGPTPRRLFVHPENLESLPPVDPAIVAKGQALVQRLKGTTHDAEAERRLGEIQCATLVVFGSKDQMVSPQAARSYREKIPNSNVSLVYDAGHVIVAERPQALINAVADYVERRETFIVGRQSSIINP